MRMARVRIRSNTIANASLVLMAVMTSLRCLVPVFLLIALIAGLTSCRLTTTAGPQNSASSRGETLYQHNCIGCHAQYATGDAFQSIPSLAGQRFEYLRQQIGMFASDQRHAEKMRWAFKRASVDIGAAANDLATYLAALPELRIAGGDARHRTQGESRYVSRCASCHGQDAQGSDAGAIPAIRAQHNGYLIHRLRQFASESPPLEPSAHSLDEESIVSIASYLSSLRGQRIDDSPGNVALSGSR
jgi:cytochrome c553